MLEFTQIRVKDGVRVEVESLLSVRRPLIMFSVFRKRLDQYDEIAPLIGQPEDYGGSTVGYVDHR